MEIYDPRYHSWDSWASLMVEAYANQQLSRPGPEADWKQWAEGFKALDSFNKSGAPGPQAFDKWQDWAQALVGAVSGTVYG
jgi:hypothetical protein